jgi:hypothetical protein
MFFEFPEDARWNDERDCVESSLILRPYEGIARIGRRVFQGLLDQRPTPERCMEAFHLQRTRFELIVERVCHNECLGAADMKLQLSRLAGCVTQSSLRRRERSKKFGRTTSLTLDSRR